jgi:hypothetical protein
VSELTRDGRFEEMGFSEHKHIFIDIGRGDRKLKYDFDSKDPIISIGMRIAARYFCRIGIDEFVPRLKGMDSIKNF